MIKINNNFLCILFIIVIMSFYTSNQNATELLLYADKISYDNKENIIAKGKAKVIYKNKIISSDLIIYSKINGDITLPLDFYLKDEKNVYYYGSNGYFKNNLDFGSINDVKVLLDDGSRIVGKNAKRDKNIDIITKGVYSPCSSKIKVANFLCPIWQLEGEKMLHDYNNLFLYQKHSKMRIFNIPVFYTPYMVSPSPLRKERKSGFLSTSLDFNFFDTKIAQATSFPYYFNIAEDKELTFTPTIHYGGGVDASQRFNFDYGQKISGGSLKTDLKLDTTIEDINSEKWLKQGSLITSYNQNLNEKYRIDIISALQTSKDYIQQTIPNDELSYSSFLRSSLTVSGYNLNKLDDVLKFNISSYQSNQNYEDNKTIPTILPYVTYFSGDGEYNKMLYSNTFEFYNIFRDKPTEIHSKTQRKISTKFLINKELVKYFTKIKFNSEIYNQIFNVEDKKIDGILKSSNYFRSFPIFGVDFETPFKLKDNKSNFIYTPKLSLIISPGISNSNKISNEDSSINTYSIENAINLNRYTGSDKLDNSKRVNLGFNISNENISGTLFQTYEFTDNSNYHYSQGNEKKLSDLLGSINYTKNLLSTNYKFRYDNYDSFVKQQNLDLDYGNKYGNYQFNYLDQKSKTDEIIVSDKETLNYKYETNKILKYSKVSYFGLYDLKNEINTESGIRYSYFDECFGVNLDFKRNSYTEGDLKPQDILTIMFSFKNIGSYKSTNLAVSENDKQEIEWENISVNNEKFN